MNSGLESVLSSEKIKKDNSDWRADCERFVRQLLDIVPASKIIIHEAYWAYKYIENGEIKEYPNQKNIALNNSLLKEYYDFLKKLIPTNIVKLEGEILGDAGHVWGLSPFHYAEDYYKEIYEQIENVTNKAV